MGGDGLTHRYSETQDPSTYDPPRAEVGKLWYVGQIQPAFISQVSLIYILLMAAFLPSEQQN